MRGWRKIFHTNRDQKKAGVAILISDKIDLKIKKIIRQSRTLQNDQRINPRRRYNNFKYLRTQHRFTTIYKATAKTSLKGEIHNNTIIVGNFNTPLTAMDRSTRQKINKETQDLNDALNQRDLKDIYRTFHPKATEYTLFSSAHGTFSKIAHILGYKLNHSNFKKTEMVSSIFSEHNAIQLEINNKKKIA